MSGFDRDRHLKPLLIGGVAILLLIGFWLYSSHQQALTRLDRKVAAARTELAQLRGAIHEYRGLENNLQQVANSSATTGADNMIAAVENATQQINARNQLLYVRPQPDKVRENMIEEGVEIKLERLLLNQLVELLYQFEHAQQKLTVSQLRVRTRFDDPAQLDTVMTLSRFREQR